MNKEFKMQTLKEFEMHTLVRYFVSLSRAQYAMLLDWFSDSDKIEIPFTGDPYIAYTDGNLVLDRAVFMEHLDDFYIYQDEWSVYGDYGVDCPMGLSHNQVVKVLEFLWQVNDFVYWFDRGFIGFDDVEE